MSVLSSPLSSTSASSLSSANDIAQNAKLQNKRIPNKNEIDATSQDFVAMFMTQMIQPMWQGVEVNKMFGGGHGEDAMRSFLTQEYGKIIAQTDRSGLTDAVKSELLKMQEGRYDQQQTEVVA